MISVCVTHLNRCRVDDGKGKELNLFPDMFECLERCAEELDEEIELIVTDWGTTDWPLEQWLKSTVMDIKIIDVPKHTPRYKTVIDRGKGRNLAAAQAVGKYLLFVDADMLFNYKYILEGQDHARLHHPYFPIVFYSLKSSNTKGVWDKNGSGNCTILRSDFRKITTGWPHLPAYKKFHGQDVSFRRKVARKFNIVRETSTNIYHPYHPGKMVDKANRKNVKQVPRRFDI